MADRVEIYVEKGAKKVFAGALAWPGWCRAARDENAALDALIEYAPRYAAVLRGNVRGFKPPNDVSTLKIIERLKGDATTDFGAPGAPPRVDAEPLTAAEIKRLKAIMRACWDTFDATAEGARSKTLRKGPRGGGRTLARLKTHVLEAEGAYLRQLGASAKAGAKPDAMRAAFLDAIDGRVKGEIADKGPRGGARWSPRYAVRRAAWHVLDHAWEIEDRS